MPTAMEALPRCSLRSAVNCPQCLTQLCFDVREVYFFLSACCLLVGATTTHGLAGGLQHQHKHNPFAVEISGDVDAAPCTGNTWKFYQPFRSTPLLACCLACLSTLTVTRYCLCVTFTWYVGHSVMHMLVPGSRREGMSGA